MPWDPDRYLRFAAERMRPGLELLNRIPDTPARLVVDLGCGTGDLAAALADRWPEAAIVGVDSADEMIERARHEYPALTWIVDDIERWEPEEPVDVVFSNAALHWLDGHEILFRRLRSFVADGGALAVQMPDNWRAPTHRIPAEVLDTGTWPQAARSALMRDRLAEPADYARWLQPGRIDLWRTTYYQQLTGPDPVWTWVTGSVLRPVLAALEADERDRFAEACRQRYAIAYPPDRDGVTTLPFSRLFVVASVDRTTRRNV